MSWSTSSFLGTALISFQMICFRSLPNLPVFFNSVCRGGEKRKAVHTSFSNKMKYRMDRKCRQIDGYMWLRWSGIKVDGRLHQPRSESENLSLFGMECSCGILIVGGRYWVRVGSAYKIKIQIEKQVNVNIKYVATFLLVDKLNVYQVQAIALFCFFHSKLSQ
jgi:hypothetical protein